MWSCHGLGDSRKRSGACETEMVVRRMAGHTLTEDQMRMLAAYVFGLGFAALVAVASSQFINAWLARGIAPFGHH